MTYYKDEWSEEGPSLFGKYGELILNCFSALILAFTVGYFYWQIFIR